MVYCAPLATQAAASPSLDIHLVAIGGTGMAPLACLLQQLGHRVRGSDGPLYPPMSDLLAAAAIAPRLGFDARNLQPAPDLVVIGNAVRRDNPEAVAAEQLGIPLISMPEALYRFCLAARRPLVVAGTHGKTTTSAMAAWVLADCGADPGYLIGGVPVDLPSSFCLGSGPRFVVEGDEYNASYFDRGPKFLHYRPETLILTSSEYDHVDLYPEPEQLRRAYAALIATLPADGLLVACGDHPEVRALAADAPCQVVFYGLEASNQVRPLEPPAAAGPGCRCRVLGPAGEEAELALSVPGHHNLTNALGVWAAACADGLPPAAVASALSRFRGVLRRLQEVGSSDGVLVVDDFAHHPTAVAQTLIAARQRYPGRRVVVLFEPRSLSAARSLFHDAYLEAFAGADELLLAPIYYRQRLAPEELLDLDGLSRQLAAAGTVAHVSADLEALLERALATLRPGDLAVCMSSGDFGGMPRRLLERLAER
jgi:UDP-N-acetylmuramate: L-alanyl-gamma-D-glutamyl-meso-diaminopimelate ligase